VAEHAVAEHAYPVVTPRSGVAGVQLMIHRKVETGVRSPDLGLWNVYVSG
jgi:hypothetical protein